MKSLPWLAWAVLLLAHQGRGTVTSCCRFDELGVETERETCKAPKNACCVKDWGQLGCGDQAACAAATKKCDGDAECGQVCRLPRVHQCRLQDTLEVYWKAWRKTQQVWRPVEPETCAEDSAACCVLHNGRKGCGSAEACARLPAYAKCSGAPPGTQYRQPQGLCETPDGTGPDYTCPTEEGEPPSLCSAGPPKNHRCCGLLPRGGDDAATMGCLAQAACDALEDWQKCVPLNLQPGQPCKKCPQSFVNSQGAVECKRKRPDGGDVIPPAKLIRHSCKPRKSVQDPEYGYGECVKEYTWNALGRGNGCCLINSGCSSVHRCKAYSDAVKCTYNKGGMGWRQCLVPDRFQCSPAVWCRSERHSCCLLQKDGPPRCGTEDECQAQSEHWKCTPQWHFEHISDGKPCDQRDNTDDPDNRPPAPDFSRRFTCQTLEGDKEDCNGPEYRNVPNAEAHGCCGLDARDTRHQDNHVGCLPASKCRLRQSWQKCGQAGASWYPDDRSGRPSPRPCEGYYGPAGQVDSTRECYEKGPPACKYDYGRAPLLLPGPMADFTCPTAEGPAALCDGAEHRCCGLLQGHKVGCLGEADCKKLHAWIKCIPHPQATAGQPCEKCQPSAVDSQGFAECPLKTAAGDDFVKPAELIRHWCMGPKENAAGRSRFGKCPVEKNGCCVVKPPKYGSVKMGCASVDDCKGLNEQEKCDYSQGNPHLPNCLVPGTFKCSDNNWCLSWKYACCILSESGAKCGTAAECEREASLTQKCTPARHFDEIAQGKACDKPDGEKFKCVKGEFDFADYCEHGSRCCDLSGDRPRCAVEATCAALSPTNKCLPMEGLPEGSVCVKKQFTCPAEEGEAQLCSRDEHRCCGLLPGHKVGCLGKADCEALEDWQKCVPDANAADGEPCEKCQPSYDGKTGASEWECDSEKGPKSKPAELIRHWCIGPKEDGSRFGKCPEKKNGCCAIKPPADGSVEMGCASLDDCKRLAEDAKCDYSQGSPRLPHCLVPGTFKCKEDVKCQSWQHACCVMDGLSDRCGAAAECGTLPPTEKCSPERHFDRIAGGDFCDQPDAVNIKCSLGADQLDGYCEPGSICCDISSGQPRCAGKATCNRLRVEGESEVARREGRSEKKCELWSPSGIPGHDYIAYKQVKVCVMPRRFTCPKADGGVVECNAPHMGQDQLFDYTHECCGLLPGHKHGIGCLRKAYCEALEDWQKCVPDANAADGEPCNKCQPSYDDKTGASEWECDSAKGPKSKPAELIRHWCMGPKEDAAGGSRFGKCPEEKNGCCVVKPPADGSVKMGCASVDSCKSLPEDATKCDYGQGNPRLPHCLVPGTFKCSEDAECQSWQHPCCILSESGAKCGTAAECQSAKIPLALTKKCTPAMHFDEIAEGKACDKPDSENFKCTESGFPFAGFCERGSKCCDLSSGQPRCADEATCAELMPHNICTLKETQQGYKVCEKASSLRKTFSCPTANGANIVCNSPDPENYSLEESVCCGLLEGHKVGCLGKEDCEALEAWQRCVPGDGTADGEPCEKCQPSYDDKTGASEWECDSEKGPKSKPAELIRHWCMGPKDDAAGRSRFGKCPKEKNGCCVVKPPADGSVKMGCASVDDCKSLPEDATKCDYGQSNPRLPHCLVPGTFKCSEDAECQSWQHPCCILSESGNKCGTAAECQSGKSPLALTQKCTPARHFDEIAEGKACDKPDGENFKCSESEFPFAGFCERGSKCCDLSRIAGHLGSGQPRCADEATCAELRPENKCTPKKHMPGASDVCVDPDRPGATKKSFTCPVETGETVMCNEQDRDFCCGLLAGHKVGCLGEADCEALEDWQKCVPEDDALDGEPCEKCQPSYAAESGVAVCQSKTAKGNDDVKPAELIRHWCMGPKEDAAGGGRFAKCPEKKNGCCVIKPPADGSVKMGCASVDDCKDLEEYEKCDFGQAGIRLPNSPGTAYCTTPGTFRCSIADKWCQSQTHSCCLVESDTCGTAEECATLPPTKTCTPYKNFQLMSQGQPCAQPDSLRFKCVKSQFDFTGYCELGSNCCDLRGDKPRCADSETCRDLKKKDKCTRPALPLLPPDGVCPRPDDRAGFKCRADGGLCPKDSVCCDLSSTPASCQNKAGCAGLQAVHSCHPPASGAVEGALCEAADEGPAYEAGCRRHDEDCAAEGVCAKADACYDGPEDGFQRWTPSTGLDGSYCGGQVVLKEGRLVAPRADGDLGPVYAFLNGALAKALDGLDLVLHCHLGQPKTMRTRRSVEGIVLTLRLQAQNSEGKKKTITPEEFKKIGNRLTARDEPSETTTRAGETSPQPSGGTATGTGGGGGGDEGPVTTATLPQPSACVVNLKECDFGSAGYPNTSQLLRVDSFKGVELVGMCGGASTSKYNLSIASDNTHFHDECAAAQKGSNVCPRNQEGCARVRSAVEAAVRDKVACAWPGEELGTEEVCVAVRFVPSAEPHNTANLNYVNLIYQRETAVTEAERLEVSVALARVGLRGHVSLMPSPYINISLCAGAAERTAGKAVGGLLLLHLLLR